MGAIKKFELDFEIILGVVILLIGGIIAAKYYGYIPKDYLVKDQFIALIGGFGCIIGGGHLAIKKLLQSSKGY